MHPSPLRLNAFVPLLLLCLGALSCLLHAAPYDGERFTYRQPDGETFDVKLYGDEFFAYEETSDGHLVIRDSKTGEFCYARVNGNGSDITSTGIRVGKTKPAGLKPKQRLTPTAAMAKSRIRRDLAGVDDNGQLKPEWHAKFFPKPAKPNHAPSPPAAAEIQFAPDGTDAGVSDTGVSAQPAPIIPITVNKRVGLVLLASFPDKQADINKTQAQIDSYCNADTYIMDGNATSVRGYFLQQSNGRFEYRCIVTAWFVAAFNQSYYTDPNASGRPAALIREGLEVLKAQNFDFSQCDGDGNGVIDGVNCFYAGTRTNTWGQGLWPQQSSSTWTGFSSHNLSTTFKYQITDMPPSLGIGTFCHENGHMLLNYPDLYRYDGNAANPGNFSLMGFLGSEQHPVHIDPALKISSGWAKVVDLDSTSHERCVVQVDRNHFYRYKNTARNGESFLFEVRDNAGYEGAFGGASRINPTSGLVVHHYLESGSNTYSSIFTSANPNASYTTPYKLLIVEASPTTAYTPWYDAPNPNSLDGFHTGGISQLSDSTTPDLKFWAANGRTTPSLAHVHGISAAGSTMSFVIGSGTITNPAELGVTTDGLVSTISGGYNAPSQEFAVFNSGAGTLNYSISVNAPWLTVSPASGSVTDAEIDKLTVNHTTTSLAGGTHLAEITITAPGGSNSPVTIPVTVHVNGTPVSPSFTVQPTGTHLLGDGTYILNSFATGSPEPTYQWYKNDVAIAGATSANLSLTNVTAAAAGTYHVVATNSLGTATSQDAVITVNDHPTIAWVTPLVDSIALAANTGVWLEATVTDDGYGGSSTSLSWTAPTMPVGGSVIWGNQSAAQTTASFSANGIYVLRFTATDGVNTVTRDIQFTVGGTSSLSTADLVVRYDFAETSGTTALDAAGGDHNATFAGNPVLDGAPLTLDGIDDLVKLPLSPDIHTSDVPYPKRTVAIHFKAQSLTGKQILFEEGGVSKGMNIYLDGSTLYWRGWNAGSKGWNSSQISTAGIQTNQWYHVTLVLDATPGGTTLESGVFRGYLNGILIGSQSGSPIDRHDNDAGIGAVNSDTAYHNGSKTGGGDWFKGQLKNFVLYNRALAAGEIHQLIAEIPTPHVDAGSPVSGMAGTSVNLDASVLVNGQAAGPEVTTTWNKVSGPGSVTFANPSVIDTNVTSNTAGSYILRLMADDGLVRTFDTTPCVFDAPSGPGFVRFSSATHAPGEATGTLMVGVERSGAAVDGAVSVTVSAADGTAVNGSDYQFTSHVVGWADQEGGVKYVQVFLTNDLLQEGNETFSLNLSGVTGGVAMAAPSQTVVTINDDEIPDTILFRDEFAATSGISLTNPASRATGTLASAITYAWTSTTGAVVDGMLNWDNNNSRNSNNEQTDATGSQNMRITNDLSSHVAGKIWEVRFTQRVGWSHPLTFGLSDTAETNPPWNLWDSTSFDFATGAYGSNLRYDTDNEGGTNGPFVAIPFPNPSNTIDTHHFRIRFDEPSGKVMVWINGIKKLDLATLDFESSGRYLCWAEPGNFAGAMDNLEIKVINTANAAPTWMGNPITTADGLEGIIYSVSLASLASDPNGDALVFSKVSGAAWLTVTADGTLSGTPTGSNLGNNTFTVGITDDLSPAVHVTLNIAVRSRFQAWAAGAASFSGDTNADGVADGIAWLLGATNSSENGIARLPDHQRENDGALTLSFRCLNAANRGSASLYLQFSRDMGALDPWSNHQVTIPTSSGTDATTGVVFAITSNGNYDDVVATIPVTAAGTSGRLFGRLMATETP